MKKFRQLFGLVFLVLVAMLLFYGVQELEKAEEARSHTEETAQVFHHNPDAYAWVTVEGTKIDYPILQHPTDDSYYLSHDAEGQETYYGAIFTEKVNTRTFEDPVTIIYGHAMRDGSMFGSLDDLADPARFEKVQTVTIRTNSQEYSYHIVAAYSFHDDHLYHSYGLGDKEQVEEYVKQLESRAQEYGGFYRPIAFDVTKDRLVILSTCDVASDGMRFVVHAIRKGD